MTLTNYKKYPNNSTYLKTRFHEGIHGLNFQGLSKPVYKTLGYHGGQILLHVSIAGYFFKRRAPFLADDDSLQSTSNTMGQRSNVCKTEMCVATTRVNLGQFLCLEITEILYQ